MKSLTIFAILLFIAISSNVLPAGSAFPTRNYADSRGNSGAGNSGAGNSGAGNSGSFNYGNHNSGDHNAGDSNSGSDNIGNHNSMNGNIGDHNLPRRGSVGVWPSGVRRSLPPRESRFDSPCQREKVNEPPFPGMSR